MKWVMLYENVDHELVETVISNVISSPSLPIKTVQIELMNILRKKITPRSLGTEKKH